MKFELDERDSIEAAKWIKEHKCKIKRDIFGRKKVGAIGGEITYSFTPTGVGCIVIVKCHCGKQLDLSHADEW